MSSPNAAPGGSPARPAFSQAVLVIDPAATAERIARAIQAYVRDVRRRGAVVAVSGGVDSAVVLGLCARALGPERVLALLMPERDSSADSVDLGRQAAARFGTPVVIEELTPFLAAAGCYERQAAAIRLLFPDYADTWRSKITLPSILDGERLNMPLLTVETPAGERLTKRLTAAAYLQLVAATNFKQRVRKMMEYYHADRLHYVVAGTPNRLEYDQGFFVKQGDGAADLKPIAHLYKTQVYQLAAWLEVPEAIRRRPPTRSRVFRSINPSIKAASATGILMVEQGWKPLFRMSFWLTMVRMRPVAGSTTTTDPL